MLEKVTAGCTRVVSSLAHLEDVLLALQPASPPASTHYHTTEWISKALVRGTKCIDDVHVIASSKPVSSATAVVSSGNDASLSKADSSGTLTSIPTMTRRSSSSKARFAEVNFDDAFFGHKPKAASKKRGKSDDETPPDKHGATSTRDEAERDSFARHLIRKKVKYSDVADGDAIHRYDDATLLLPGPNDEFSLNYDMSDDDENVSFAPNSALATNFKKNPSPKKDIESKKPEHSEVEAKDATKTGVEAETIWFTGSELPRVLDGVRATEKDDFEDPKFYSILKPAPEPDQRAVEDEIRFAGPWAHRLHRAMSAAINEAFGDDEVDESPKNAPPRATHDRQQLVASVDSDENDFSESQVAVDQNEFEKNFGHQHKPLSAYWERQRANLACQKLPVPSSSVVTSTSSNPSGTVVTSSRHPVKENHNKIITDQLEKLEAICLGSGDKWRGYAYRKAANILKALSYKIESMEDALKLRGIGTSIAEKIGEIISTGKLRKLDALQSEERIQVLSTFMGIFGVGQSTANKWCALGYKTLADVQKHATLTYAQAVGLKYYDEFQLRIPRQEMETICNAIKTVIRAIDELFIVEICGSYRRGKSDCGDIDIIITHKRPAALKNILYEAVPKLHEARILTHDFVTINEGTDKYMGVCQANPNGVHRRIDMLTVPPVEWPFALCYFTGSGHFNRSMRFWAGKRGYSLSQHGLRVNYGNDNKGPYIAGITTEKQIFEALGLEYRPPEDRDV